MTLSVQRVLCHIISFLLEVFRQDGYKNCTHNIYTNSFYVNIVFILIINMGDSNGRSASYDSMEYAEAATIS